MAIRKEICRSSREMLNDTDIKKEASSWNDWTKSSWKCYWCGINKDISKNIEIAWNSRNTMAKGWMWYLIVVDYTCDLIEVEKFRKYNSHEVIDKSKSIFARHMGFHSLNI